MIEERKFLSNWGLAILLAVLVWLFIFLEAVLTLSLMGSTELWMHNYMVFAAAGTFAAAFVYMRKIKRFEWLEGPAFGIVFIIIHILMDYGVLFIFLESQIFNLQNFMLYVAQFILCLLAAFVVKKKYIFADRI